MTICAVPLAASASSGEFRVLLAEGDAAPYAGAGLSLKDIQLGRFNAHGQLAAVISVGPALSLPATESLLVATEMDGHFRVVARESVPLPNAPSDVFRFGNSNSPFINGNGEVAFGAAIYPSGIGQTFYETIWSEVDGLHLVDSRLSEPSHRRYVDINGISDNGNVLFTRDGYSFNGSVLTGDDPELLIEENGSSRFLFKRYMSAPVGGCPSGQACFLPYQDFLFDKGLTADGAAIFGTQIKGNGIDTLNNDVQFRSTAAGTQVLIRDGDPAWGLPEGYRFSHVTGPFVLPSGEVIFPSYLAPPTGAVELQYSLFANTGGQ